MQGPGRIADCVPTERPRSPSLTAWDLPPEAYPGLDDFYIDGLCFKRLSEESGCVGALLRYEQRATSSALRAWTLLRQLQGKRPPVDGGGPVQNPGPPAPLDPRPHPLPPRVPPNEPMSLSAKPPPSTVGQASARVPPNGLLA